MFYLALVLSLLCWGICTNAMRQPQPRIGYASAWCFIVGFLPMVLMTPVHSVWLVAILLMVLMVIWKANALSSRSFVYASLLPLFGTFGGCGYQAYQDVLEAQREYPLISLESRLPAVPVSQLNDPDAGRPNLSKLAISNLQLVEEQYESPSNTYQSERRQVYRDLHERAFHVFAMSPNFGVTRMPLTFAILSRLKSANSREYVKFEVDFVPLSLSISEVDILPVPAFASFSTWLIDSIYRFAPIESLGYQTADKRVAGFFAHGRKNYAKQPEAWGDQANKEYDTLHVRRLELISLLLHDAPVAYASNTLPAMDEVKLLKTRPLDPFEAIGLLKLQAGEDLYVKEYQGRTLVLGALRNAKQCQSCHDGERGKLLGAFSYDLEQINKKQAFIDK